MPASPSRPTPPVPEGARPGGAPADLAAVWAVITGMYLAYTAGDREHTDSYLDPEATVWDSATPRLACGRTELDRVRDGRPAAGEAPRESGLTAYDHVIDVFGDLALARYWLRVDFHAPAPDAVHPPALVRNTAVLRRTGTGWLMVHLHEDVQRAG
jgi:ketosteroid isomerase-like protein